TAVDCQELRTRCSTTSPRGVTKRQRAAAKVPSPIANARIERRLSKVRFPSPSPRTTNMLAPTASAAALRDPVVRTPARMKSTPTTLAESADAEVTATRRSSRAFAAASGAPNVSVDRYSPVGYGNQGTSP